MNTKLKIANRRWAETSLAMTSMDNTLKKIFPKGAEITFRFRNMREPHTAEVVWANITAGRPLLCVNNKVTGTYRIISLEDVVDA